MYAYYFRSRNQDEVGRMIVEVVSLCTILKASSISLLLPGKEKMSSPIDVA